MEQCINRHGKPSWKDVSTEDVFSEELFYEVPDQVENNRQWAFHSNLGSITVLERMTCFGWWAQRQAIVILRGSFGWPQGAWT
jgi:hypothetical protein